MHVLLLVHVVQTRCALKCHVAMLNAKASNHIDKAVQIFFRV